MALGRRLTHPLTALLALAFGGAASAQALSDLLPAETFFALGMRDLAGASAYLEDFSEAFERLGVADAFAALGAGAAVPDDATGGAVTGGAMTGGAMTGGATLDVDPDEAERRLRALATLDVFGQEAWISLSATPYNPVPAAVLLTSLTPEATEEVRALLDDPQLGDGADVQTFEESGYTFTQLTLGVDSPVPVVAYALADDVLALATNPDELRGVLRRLSGADEPSFAASAGFERTLGTLEAGTFYGYLDYARIAEAVGPYSQGLGFDRLATRLGEAFATAGQVGGVARLSEEALITQSVQVTDEAGGDAQLYTLLSDDAPVQTDVLVPPGALSVSANAFDLGGWYDYLNALALTVPELGGDLDSLLLSIAGVSPRDTLLNWTGSQVVTINTGFGAVPQPGVPSDNLLGESAYLLEATNENAAERGLGTLLNNLSQSLAAFGDPQGTARGEVRTEEIAGVTVTRYRITAGAELLYAVEGGYAIIATSEDAMRETLAAQLEGAGVPLRELLGEVPEGATAVAYADGRRTFEGVAAQLSAQLQLAAGMGGAGTLDFNAVDEASEALEAFVAFVAERLGPSTGYSERVEGTIRSYSEAEVQWRR
jgi:hypothetical protein